MNKFQVYTDGRAGGANPISGSDFVTKDYFLQLSGSIVSASYNSTDKKIYFYNNSGSTSAFIDATDFIKDGMVDNVTVSGSFLVITFNTDAGKEPVSMSLTRIFDPNNYYTKDDTDVLLQNLPVGDINVIEAITFNGTASVITDKTASISFTEKDLTYSADSGSLKASASVATSASNWITQNSSSLHSHSNKSLLDNLTLEQTASWDTAASQAHTHSNGSLLNSLTNVKTGSWDSAATSATALNGISASLIASGTLAKNVTAITASLIASASVAKTASSSAAAISTKTGSWDALVSLPTVTSADNGKILRVINGAWTLVDPVTVYSGQGAPDSALGQDGDIYLQS